jgi:acetyltransferase-like isoleucine patch superfamily enzyme
MTRLIDRLYDYYIERINVIERRYFLRKYPGQIRVKGQFRSDRFLNIQIDGRNGTVDIGNGVTFRRNTNILVMGTGRVVIGDRVFLNNFCSINCIDSVEIGEGTICGEGVKIYDHNHAYSSEGGVLTIERANFKSQPVVIGKDCWLGSSVTVLKGVTIGNNCIIGANCLIFKDVPPNSVIVSEAGTVALTNPK